jgi:hypothetical protein
MSVTQDGIIENYGNDAHDEIEPPSMRKPDRQLNSNREESRSLQGLQAEVLNAVRPAAPGHGRPWLCAAQFPDQPYNPNKQRGWNQNGRQKRQHAQHDRKQAEHDSAAHDPNGQKTDEKQREQSKP